MYMNGWIKIHRKSMESSIFNNPIYWQVWCWCLMKATHDNYKFPFNGNDVTLKPGQFITGQIKASKELVCSVQNYKSAIKYLKLTNRITTKPTNRFTIITIVKWEQYQVKDDKVTSQVTSQVTIHQPATNQPLTTYKNNKNIKKDIPTKNPIEIFSSSGYLDKMKVGKPNIQIIALFIIYKEIVLLDYDHAKSLITRNLKVGQKLAMKYGIERTEEVMGKLAPEYNKNKFSWGLEAILKYLEEN